MTSVGPVLPQISAELGLGPQAQGLLGAIPLLAFAAASPLVHALTGRLGRRRVTALALAGIVVGVAVRSLPGASSLWIGTIVMGVSIAVGNIVVAGLVKRDFPERVSVVTGLYAAVMGIAAACGSGLSAPLAAALGGWRPGLAMWLIPAGLALIAWLVIGRADVPAPASPGIVEVTAAPSVWRSPLAWMVTGFFGTMSLSFYVVVVWLPTMARQLNLTASEAGWLAFVFLIVGVVIGPIAAALAGRLPKQRPLTIGSALALATAIVGVLVAPQAVWVWVALAGGAIGAGFTLSLALPPLRTTTPADTVRLAGMSQSIGYLIAAIGPVAAGALAAAAGWGVVLVVMLGLAVVQAVLGWGAGADRHL